MTAVVRWARIASGPAILLAAVIGFGWVGYWLLDNARRPVSLLAFVVVMAFYAALLAWVLLQRRDDRELIDKAVDDADRALAATGHAAVAVPDDLGYGRHAATRTPTTEPIKEITDAR